MDSLAREMDVAAEVAWQAGRITLRYYQGDFDAELKDDDSPVTAADREAEQYIRRHLELAFPDDGILGEEFGERTGSSGRRWIVDPIDGTKSFVQGIPLYGVLVGLETVRGSTLAGAVYIPALDEMVCAATGEGCWWNGARARVSAVDELSAACLCYTSSRSFDAESRGACWSRLSDRARLVRGWGDCYGHLLVATGRAEAMFDPVINPWDCCALVPILLEAGGTFTDWKGGTTIYGGDGFSSNGRVFDQILAHIGDG